MTDFWKLGKPAKDYPKDYIVVPVLDVREEIQKALTDAEIAIDMKYSRQEIISSIRVALLGQEDSKKGEAKK